MKKRAPDISCEAVVEKALRDGVPESGIADTLVRVYGFDAGSARKIAASVRRKFRRED